MEKKYGDIYRDIGEKLEIVPREIIERFRYYISDDKHYVKIKIVPNNWLDGLLIDNTSFDIPLYHKTFSKYIFKDVDYNTTLEEIKDTFLKYHANLLAFQHYIRDVIYKSKQDYKTTLMDELCRMIYPKLFTLKPFKSLCEEKFGLK